MSRSCIFLKQSLIIWRKQINNHLHKYLCFILGHLSNEQEAKKYSECDILGKGSMKTSSVWEWVCVNKWGFISERDHTNSCL